uniref:Putative S locus-related glycoprotein 1 binding pollen coat protein n=1 Tax=Helianthus annuus TaxID=4232 RepID=A0A251U766_HELAN
MFGFCGLAIHGSFGSSFVDGCRTVLNRESCNREYCIEQCLKNYKGVGECKFSIHLGNHYCLCNHPCLMNLWNLFNNIQLGEFF